MKNIIMKKLNPQGIEVWRYPASLIFEDETMIQLEAPFNGRDLELMGTPIRNGDIFKETFYKNRWYNFFAIHDQEDGSLKGWYCNIGMPVVEEGEGIFSYVDLALDLWVDARGGQYILDEDEFNKLDIASGTRAQAQSALKELMEFFVKKSTPTK